MVVVLVVVVELLSCLALLHLLVHLLFLVQMRKRFVIKVLCVSSTIAIRKSVHFRLWLLCMSW